MGIDNLSVAVSLGLSGVSSRQAVGIPLLFTGFQTVLPALGLLLGEFVGTHVGRVASFVGFGVLIVLGVYTVLMAQKEERSPKARHVVSFLLAALAVSLDSLAVGFTLSFVGVRPVVVIVALGVSALVMTSLGLLFGDRIGRRAGRFAEVLAGIVLALTGVGLILERLVG